MTAAKYFFSLIIIFLVCCIFYSCRPRVGYNKYLYMKETPSEKIAKDHGRANRKASRAYAKEMRKLRKKKGV